MGDTDWGRIFSMKTLTLKYRDRWCLQFDDSIVPDNPNHGWEQYIRNTGARFKCSGCGRSWPSNRVMVVFHMRLTNGQGTVKVRRFRQDCKMCAEAPMEMPSIPSENIEILMENLVKKIRIKCYHEDLERNERPFRNLDVNNPHEPDHCEACKQGFCKRSSDFSGFF